MFEVRDVNNELLISTADLELAEIIQEAATLARCSFHKLMTICNETGTVPTLREGPIEINYGARGDPWLLNDRPTF